MLLSKIFKNLYEGKNIPSTTATKIPPSLINEIYYHLFDEIIPGIFDYINKNNIDIIDFIENTETYQYEIFENVIEDKILIKYFDLLNLENKDFVQKLIDNQILDINPFKLIIVYHTNKSLLFDEYEINIDIENYKKNKTSLGFFSIIGTQNYERNIESTISLNISRVINEENYEKYLNSPDDFYNSIEFLYHDFLKTTIRHELEHYYQNLNKLMKNIRIISKEAVKEGKDEIQELNEIIEDLNVDTVGYYLRYKIRGHEYLESVTDYICSVTNPYKINSTSNYYNKINRSYMFDENELATLLNDFVYLYTKFAKAIFLDPDSAISWLKQFLIQFKVDSSIKMDEKYIENQINTFLNSKEFFLGKDFSQYITKQLPRKIITKEDLINNQYYKTFKLDFSSQIDIGYLIFLKEVLFENSQKLISDLDPSINKDLFIEQFLSLRKELYKKLYHKINTAWNDPDLFNI